MNTIVHPAVKSVTLSTGVTLPYAEQGNPAGLPVVFLHGFSDSLRSWESVLPHLPDSIHAIALTQRGHGDADRPATGYGFNEFAADLAAFLDALELESAVLVGHSMGSYVAQRFAMDHPARTRALVLVGTVTTWRGNAVVRDLWDGAIATFTDSVDADFVREFQASPKLSPEFHDMVVQESLKAPARVWQAAWRSIMTTDHAKELPTIQAPTLIIWGDQDPLCPWSEQEALVAAISQVRHAVYPSSGHNTHWDEPQRFAADLIAFTAALAG